MSTVNNIRIKHKTATSADWAKAENFAPLKGELIIYQDEGKAPRIKIGTGADGDYVNNLPFVSDNVLIVTTSPVQDGTYYTSHSANEIYQYVQEGYGVYLKHYIGDEPEPNYFNLINISSTTAIFAALSDDLQYRRFNVYENTLEYYEDYLLNTNYAEYIEEDLHYINDWMLSIPTIHHGTTVPDENLGKPGDLYIMYAE